MVSSGGHRPVSTRREAGKTLVSSVRAALLDQIGRGKYEPGDRLPSEARLTEEFSVSRTVIREAIAALRADRVVESRQGAGIFVLRPEKLDLLAFRGVDPGRISSTIELLEIRTAVECEAAALAALRRSPVDGDAIAEALWNFMDLAKAGKSTSAADFQLHMAIAQATQNSRFPEFLSLVGPGSIPRQTLESDESDLTGYLDVLCEQHEAIVRAILEGDDQRARAEMREHLRGSQARYRFLLRRRDRPPAGP
ncbi:MAG: FadR/GntR family transcriptional regulator [Tropicimonas sp.]|uniref:FadR/GntR family transcriptional regulator n=1 Tax=Tropicimonas sp. TaxID=2067044 RepID=UPI003A85B318